MGKELSYRLKSHQKQLQAGSCPEIGVGRLKVPAMNPAKKGQMAVLIRQNPLSLIQ